MSKILSKLSELNGSFDVDSDNALVVIGGIGSALTVAALAFLF